MEALTFGLYCCFRKVVLCQGELPVRQKKVRFYRPRRYSTVCFKDWGCSSMVIDEQRALVLKRIVLAIVSFAILGSCGVLMANRRQHASSIAVIARTSAAPIWEAAHAGAQDAATLHRISVYWNAPPSEDDVQEQAELIDRVVGEHFAGLIVAPDQPMALITSIQHAVAHGVRTVVIMSPLPLPLVENLAYIVNDDEKAGWIAAKRVNEVLHGKGSVAVLGVNPESLSDLRILHSFEAAIDRDFPGIIISDCRTGSHHMSEAQEIVDEALDTHPQLDAVFALSAVTTSSAFTSIAAHGLTKKVTLIGFEQSPALVNKVRTGAMDSLIVVDSYEMGRQAMELLVADRGHAMDPEIRRLPPKLLTRTNIDEPEMQHFVRLEWGVKP
jgi:ribose transport system substrate-binding protein